MRRASFLVSLLVLVVALPSPAQDALPALTTGFTPDPIRLTGRTSGAQPLSARAAGCRGYVGGGPDQTIELGGRFGFLRFFVTAAEEVTLALRGPDGRWRCSGRPLYGAPHEQGTFEPGRYEVWIGSARPNVQVSYELNVTEFRSVTPATGRGDESLLVSGGAEIGLAITAQRGRFRDRRLRRGFLPDPREDGGEAGGTIDVALLGGACRGHVAEQPSHVLELRDDMDYFRIEVREAPEQTVLVVRAPGGGFLCNAPESGEPVLERESWPRGRYLVWVGTRRLGPTPRYRISYSETRPPSR